MASPGPLPDPRLVRHMHPASSHLRVAAGVLGQVGRRGAHVADQARPVLGQAGRQGQIGRPPQPGLEEPPDEDRDARLGAGSVGQPGGPDPAQAAGLEAGELAGLVAQGVAYAARGGERLIEADRDAGAGIRRANSAWATRSAGGRGCSMQSTS